jgi:O-antigen/teichoic acid export membrane protein
MTSEFSFKTTRVRNRLIRGFGASALGPITTALIQVLGVPIFLRCWGANRYGEWLVLSSIPIYLSLSDVGFGSVAANEMTMRVAASNREGALETFQSAWVFISILSFTVALIASLSASLLPLASWLHFASISRSEAGLVLLLLTLYALVALQSTLVVSGFRCDGNYAIGMLLTNLVRIFEVGAATTVVILGGRPVAAATAYLIVRSIGMIILNAILKHKSPWIRYGIGRARFNCVRRLVKPAFSFMAFPVGQALNVQGMLLIIGLELGPVAVVSYSTLRTLTRFAAQPTEALRSAIWPELSAAFGTDNISFARKLHERTCKATVWACIGAVLALIAIGPRIYAAWTHQRIAFEPILFYTLIAVVVVNSFWYTSSIVPVACNRHQAVAMAYLFCSCASIALAAGLLPFMKASGAAIALLLTDATMTWYVMQASMNILQESPKRFIRSLLSVPTFGRIFSVAHGD